MTEVKIIDDNFDIDLFNKHAKHPIQSWEWGEARKETGLNILRFGEFENGLLIRSYTLTFHKIPFIGSFIGYLGMSWIPSSNVLEYLKSISRERKVAFYKIEPDFFREDLLEVSIDSKYLRKSSSPNFYEWTYLVNLELEEKDLLKNLKNTWRYNIGLARRKGVEIIHDDSDKGFETFLRVFIETTKRQNYSGHNEKYHRAIWNNLKNKIAHILYAKYQDDIVAAIEVFFFNGRLYYPYGGSLPLHRQFKAPNLLVWESMLYGKGLGAKDFDMWGVAHPDDKSHEWASITEFKMGFGGKLKQLIGSYDLVINKLVYSLYSLAYFLRKVLKRIR